MQINKWTYYINRVKDKNHDLLSIDTEKALDKTQPPFIVKTLKRVGTQETQLKIKKVTY